jgi:hypothetical protein
LANRVNLTLSAKREPKEMKIPIHYKPKVDGDKLQGKAEAEVGGEKREFDIAGTREKTTTKRDHDEKEDEKRSGVFEMTPDCCVPFSSSFPRSGTVGVSSDTQM